MLSGLTSDPQAAVPCHQHAKPHRRHHVQQRRQRAPHDHRLRQGRPQEHQLQRHQHPAVARLPDRRARSLGQDRRHAHLRLRARCGRVASRLPAAGCSCAAATASARCASCPAATKSPTLHHQMGVHLTLDDKDSPMIFQTGRAADFSAGFTGFRIAVEKKTSMRVRRQLPRATARSPVTTCVFGSRSRTAPRSTASRSS